MKESSSGGGAALDKVRIWAGAGAISIGITAVVLTGCTQSSEDFHGRQAIPSPKPSADVFGLVAGECIERPSSGSSLTELTTVDCEKPHEGEIYKTIEAPSVSFNDGATVKKSAIAGCENAFKEFAGISYSNSRRLTFWWIGPTEKSWTHGDRTIVCAIEKLNAKGQPTTNTGTLHNANE